MKQRIRTIAALLMVIGSPPAHGQPTIVAAVL